MVHLLRPAVRYGEPRDVRNRGRAFGSAPLFTVRLKTMALTTAQLAIAIEDYMGWAAGADDVRTFSWLNAGYRRFLRGNYTDERGIVRHHAWSFLAAPETLTLPPTQTSTLAATWPYLAERLYGWLTDGRPQAEDLRGDPCVVWDPDASLWRMYMCYDPNDESQGDIRMATSPDMINWSASSVVMARSGEPGAVANGGFAAWYMHPYVVKDGATWKMWWCGKHNDPLRPGNDSEGFNRHAMRYATSTDGVTWTRYANGNYGIVYTGTSNWDPVRFRNVIWDPAESQWVCYFGSNNNEALHGPGRDFGISLMTSPDGITWTRNTSSVDRFSTQLLFDICPVRWDESDGTERWVAVMAEATTDDSAARWKLGIWTAASLYGFRDGQATFQGYIAGTEDTDDFEMEGLTIAYADKYQLLRPNIMVSDKTCNVTDTVRAQDPLWLFAYARLQTTWTGNNGNIVAFRYEPGMYDATRTASDYRLPLAAPMFQLATRGADANVVALWMPGTAGSCDLSGNGLDMRASCRTVAAAGFDFETGSSDNLRRRTGSVQSALEAITGDFTIRFAVSLESALAAAASRWVFSVATLTGTSEHFAVFLTTADGTNLYWRVRSHTAGGSISCNSDTFTWTPGTTLVEWEIGRNGANVYFFKDGVQSGATKTLTGTLLTDTTGDIALTVGASYARSAGWDGLMTYLEVSKVCRHTAGFTPATPTLTYATTGYVFSGVADLGTDQSPAAAEMLDAVTPAGTTLTLYVRAASSATDASSDISDFSAYSAPIAGRYQQFAVKLTGTGANTPTISGIQTALARTPDDTSTAVMLTVLECDDAIFYPTMENLDAAFTASSASYSLAKYGDATHFAVEGDATGEAVADTVTVTATGIYALPSDFAGKKRDPVFAGDGYTSCQFEEIPPVEIKQHRRDVTEAGTPEYWTMEPQNVAATDEQQRWAIIVSPTPDELVSFNYAYLHRPATLTSASTTYYPVGGADHSDTIRACAVAEAERTRARQGGYRQVLANEAMRESVAFDIEQSDSGQVWNQIEVEA